ncbi:MAG TPA: M14 family zinc carboxypeptidase [Pseudomonadales bacterium]|nr:M14 family zinc carboxypeptidase [Pseudomonadales bacterium]
MNRRLHALLRAFLLLALAGPAVASAAVGLWRAGEDPVGWPGVRMDPAIPTLEGVVGHAPGTRITSPDEAYRYIAALAEAAPERTRLVEYARSWEGRPLVYLLVGSAETMARVDAVKAGMQALADPADLADDRLEALVDDLPAVVWLAYGVHGNEISSTDAALQTAYHLLAAEDDALFDRLTAGALVGIDPMQNPDGRERFVHHYRQTEGLQFASSAIAAERREPWPNGRTNHYLFDLNRDWLSLTQPEVQGRVATFLEFHPLVHVDVHEMNTERTYYFPPPAAPFNPHITATQKGSLDDYGRNNAKWFDAFGFEYFTAAVYDAYYPGYGDSWPAFQGSVGMTFEAGSARGMAAERTNGTVVTYAGTVQRHFVASISTIDNAVANRERYLRDFVAYRRSADAGEAGGPREYLLPRTGDPGAVDKLATRLVMHGIEVRRTTEGGRACGVDLPAGSYLVTSRQPAGRMVRTFLEDESPMDAAFLAEQERRRDLGLRAQLYDILGWSLPRLYNVAVTGCDRVSVDARAFDGGAVAAFAPPAPSSVGWLIPWGTRASGRFLAAAQRGGLSVQGADEAFTIAGRRYERGALVVRTADHADLPRGMLHSLMTELAAATGAEVVATDSSYSEEGLSFGSDAIEPLPAPRIALAWDTPTAVSSAGNTRFVLERQFGYPVEPVRTRDLARPELDRYDVLILPDGRDYAGELGKRGVARLQDWVARGGVVVGLSGGMRFLAEDEVGLLPTDLERLANGKAPADRDGDRVDGTIIEDAADYQTAILPESPAPDSIPGVLMRTVPDRDSWLSVGVRDGVNFMVEGRDVYVPLTLDQGWNALRFAPAEDIAVGGHLWAENRAQWAYKPAVMIAEHGAGLVIGFVADPTFRAALDGANIVFLNAVLRAPGHTSKLR